MVQEINTGRVSHLQDALEFCPTEVARSAAKPGVTVFIVATETSEYRLGYRIAKRIADVVIASTALLLCFPLFLFVAIAIWLEDRGPILFIAPRVGQFGAPIRFYKFRSMTVNAEKLKHGLLGQSDAQGVAFKMKNDPRVTKVGRFLRKFSIDELPQLLSVLLGDMSIVGPRPLPISEGYACGVDNFKRYIVKPGLLCLREVSGRSNLTFERWMELDLEYVRTRNLLLDLKIFLKLIPALLAADGAY
jgi:lipopolysaccharide/colanic/teichoic acid biosynthesis glycosyltransferase